MSDPSMLIAGQRHDTSSQFDSSSQVHGITSQDNHAGDCISADLS